MTVPNMPTITSPKRVVILHGYGETPDWSWFKWLRSEMEKEGVATEILKLPDPLIPNYGKWLKKGLESAINWDKNTIVVGHSLGGVLALRLLDQKGIAKVHAVITVGSPFTCTLPAEWLARFFDRSIDWKSLRAKAEHFVVLQGAKDPLVSFDHSLRYGEVLGVTPRIFSRAAHFLLKKSPEVLAAVKEHLK